MTNLDTLKSRAENVQANFEREQAKLFRPDGSKLYSDDEHAEREDALRSERHQWLTQIEASAKEERAAALEQLELIENADPLAVLSDDELRRAEPRRSFVADEVWGLDEEGLLARLRSVRASGDRAAMFLYWQTARSHQSMRDDAMGRRNRIPTELTRELDEIHEELAGPERRRRIADAKAQGAKAGEVLMGVGSLKRGGSSNPARSYLNKKYARERLPSPLTSARET